MSFLFSQNNSFNLIGKHIQYKYRQRPLQQQTFYWQCYDTKCARIINSWLRVARCACTIMLVLSSKYIVNLYFVFLCAAFKRILNFILLKYITIQSSVNCCIETAVFIEMNSTIGSMYLWFVLPFVFISATDAMLMRFRYWCKQLHNVLD